MGRMQQKQPLTKKRILEWADNHHARTGRWPISRSGPILDADDGTTWQAVNTALVKGTRGQPGADSLTRLLRRRRKILDARAVWPDLTRDKILQWVDDHNERTGAWPRRDSGRVRCARGISWATVDRYLRKGNRSFAGGSSLTELLWTARHVWDGRPPLTEAKILRWAREHHDRTGRWPVTLSGKLIGASDDDWAAIDMALRNKRRGLPRRTSLSRLLSEHYRGRYRVTLGRITIRQIVKWAERHYRRTGTWPTHHSGPVSGVPNLSWAAIEYALRCGRRGLPGGSTLVRVLEKPRRGGGQGLNSE